MIGAESLPRLHAAEVRRDVLARQQPPIQLDCPGSEIRPLRDPLLCVVAERDLDPFPVRPIASDDALDLHQPTVGVRFLLAPVRSEVPLAIRPEVAGLELTKRRLADAPEPTLGAGVVQAARNPL